MSEINPELSETSDLRLEKFWGPGHQDGIIYCYDSATQKPLSWTELSHLVGWSTQFVSTLKNNKSSLATLILRGPNEYPISLAKFFVDEAISIVKSAINFELGLDIQHPDTRGQNYAVTNVLIEESTEFHDIIRQVFTCLFSKCAIRLVVKRHQPYSTVLASSIVDLMHQSGATPSEIKCLVFDRRDSVGNERFIKCFQSNRSSKLSVIATVFKQTDTFAAAQGILESYFREQYPNLIILVEEAAYERFVKDWQRYYSHAIQIGPRMDDRTTVVDTFNRKVQIDLAAIDIKASHKMAGDVINVLRFRTLAELNSLLNNLRKVPHMSVWNDNVLLAREFCLRLNLCDQFWLNHIPRSLAGRMLPETILNYSSEIVADNMTNLYNSVYSGFSEEVEQLRKIHATFVKKNDCLRSFLIIQAFNSIISRMKSLKNGATVGEAIARLKRFQLTNVVRGSVTEAGDSRIETIIKPVGLAILVVREESVIKSKAVLVEFICKNLLIGNAVLLACPPNTLGAKFAFENDNVVPFKMVHDSLPDISQLSLEDTSARDENASTKKQCPKNTYAIEISPDMTSESFESLIAALGTRRKSVWYPDIEQSNYWANE